LSKVHIGFWTNKTIADQKLLEFINRERGERSYAQYVKDVLTDVKDERLIIPTAEDLRNQKMKVDIEFKKIMVKIKKKELLYWDVFKNTPSPRAQTAIKVGVENQISVESVSCVDEKNHRMVCPQCQNVIEFAKDQHDLKDAKLLFIDHYYKLHGEMPPKLERELLDLE